jgi:hypothetical protein
MDRKKALKYPAQSRSSKSVDPFGRFQNYRLLSATNEILFQVDESSTLVVSFGLILLPG